MIFTNLLLAFQLENYRNKRFLRFVYNHFSFWFFGSKRQKLEYTQKAKLLLIVSLLLFCIATLLSFVLLWSIFFWIVLGISLFCLPLFFVFANILLSPLDNYLKNHIIERAKLKIREFKNLKVIAITGSYGKTTTKEILKTILSEKYNVLATEGTKNTPLGISRLILSELTIQHHIFIVEMGAYEKGNIKELCELVRPTISLLTGITLQHLERFKTLDNIIDAKFEILEFLSENDFAVIDISTQAVQKWLNKKTLKVKNIETIQKWLPYSYKQNLSGIVFHIDWQKYETKLLANYILQTLEICYKVSNHLWVSVQQFAQGVSKVDFVEHRMQLLYNPQSNVYVIDDSFNGNLEGIEAILDLMKYAPFYGRKILIAGWVVELGEKTEEIHLKLGRQMSTVADIILLVEWPVGNALKKWLQQANYKAQSIRIYKTPLELHEDLKNIIKNGDMVVFQNDLPDNYL